MVSVDSVQLAQMQQALSEAHLNEMNLRMEMEALRMATIVSDSLKRAEQKQHIDSLRHIIDGVPVVVEGDTLYSIYAKQGSVSPQSRAIAVSESVLELGKEFTLKFDSIRIEESDISTDILYKDKVIASFTDIDGMWYNTSREELAAQTKLIISNKIGELQQKYGLMQFVKRILIFLGILLIQILLIWCTNWLYRRTKLKIGRVRHSKWKAFYFRDYELLDTHKQIRLLVFFANILRYIIIIVQLLISIPILFSIFPQTENLAYKMFSYVWNPLKNISAGVVDYVPNLFTIIVIWLVIHYLVKTLSYLAEEIQTERLKINGFFPDWAQPTYQIVRFLLYAFMIAMVYPYLPGAGDGVFQGVSVFVGLIISLGSTTVISNIMAGLVITYMRPYKIGDRIKLNETVGNVIEKTPFITRIRTPKNEIVTIPNSFVLSSHTINYSASARDLGLIIHSEVSFGFEVHWSRVHELLIKAALNTTGVMTEPAPFVLETSLQDFYPIYQINAYIRDADKLAGIYSDLHRNIQDLANEAGIELLSPHYYATRDGSEIAIPKEYRGGKN